MVWGWGRGAWGWLAPARCSLARRFSPSTACPSHAASGLVDHRWSLAPLLRPGFPPALPGAGRRLGFWGAAFRSVGWVSALSGACTAWGQIHPVLGSNCWTTLSDSGHVWQCALLCIGSLEPASAGLGAPERPSLARSSGRGGLGALGAPRRTTVGVCVVVGGWQVNGERES